MITVYVAKQRTMLIGHERTAVMETHVGVWTTSSLAGPTNRSR